METTRGRRRGAGTGLVIALALGPLAMPPGAGAQPAGKSVSIGILSLAARDATAGPLRALEEGLRDLGYVEGRNVVFERRFADGRLERLPDLAAELVGLRVDVLVAPVNPEITAAKRATATIPIVMVHGVDPVGAGFVASLARPGGNITGLSFDAGQETAGKRLEQLKEIVPRLSQVAVLRQAESGGDITVLDTAARALNMTLLVVDVRGLEDFEGAFAGIVRVQAGAVVVQGGPLTWMRRQQIADFALKHRLPSTHALKEYAQAGFLITYGPSIPDLYRRAAGHIARILKGARPGELPVEQPTTFELVINLRTAKALGLTIPPSLLLRADEVIE